ncbi:MAG: protein translocase subunit SecF [Ruminococcus sp.]|nr:protein translocase subunit SecF [Ruminococcus sp.]
MKNEQKIYNFCGNRKLVASIAVIFVLLAVIGTLIMKVDVAIEFKGGTIITYNYVGDINTKDVEKVISDTLNLNAKVGAGENLSTGENNITVEFTSKEGLSAERQNQLSNALNEKFADNKLEILDSNDVNPTTGKEFFLKCLVAVLFAALLIIVYVALRFKKIGGWPAGVCSVIALFHDMLVVYVAFIFCGFEINSNFMAVILTILGYSINNTIVIYDRIRENKSLMPKASLREITNTGCTQSLTRSVRTTVTTLGTMLIVSIVVFASGYTSLLSFSIPLIFGLISGAYSSLFVSTTVWVAWLEKAETKKKANKSSKK